MRAARARGRRGPDGRARALRHCPTPGALLACGVTAPATPAPGPPHPTGAVRRMALARFLQVSDLHLGRPFAWLSAERREQRRRDQQRALEAAVGQAIERGAHAILLPGDLFDAAATDAGTLAFAVKAFAVHGCPPVF